MCHPVVLIRLAYKVLCFCLPTMDYTTVCIRAWHAQFWCDFSSFSCLKISCHIPCKRMETMRGWPHVWPRRMSSYSSSCASVSNAGEPLRFSLWSRKTDTSCCHLYPLSVNDLLHDELFPCASLDCFYGRRMLHKCCIRYSSHGLPSSSHGQLRALKDFSCGRRQLYKSCIHDSSRGLFSPSHEQIFCASSEQPFSWWHIHTPHILMHRS